MEDLINIGIEKHLCLKLWACGFNGLSQRIQMQDFVLGASKMY